MSKYSSIKIGGKSTKKTSKSAKSSGRQSKIPKLSQADQELHTKVSELQQYMADKNIPHYIVCQLPDSRQPLATASFSATDDPQRAMINAEWMFTHVGGFMQHITNGFLRLIKFY
jgi:hypothetical protein